MGRSVRKDVQEKSEYPLDINGNRYCGSYLVLNPDIPIYTHITVLGEWMIEHLLPREKRDGLVMLEVPSFYNPHLKRWIPERFMLELKEREDFFEPKQRIRKPGVIDEELFFLLDRTNLDAFIAAHFKNAHWRELNDRTS